MLWSEVWPGEFYQHQQDQYVKSNLSSCLTSSKAGVDTMWCLNGDLVGRYHHHASVKAVWIVVVM